MKDGLFQTGLFEYTDWDRAFKRFSALSREEIVERARKAEGRLRVASAVEYSVLLLGLVLFIVGAASIPSRVANLLMLAGCVNAILGGVGICAVHIMVRMYLWGLWQAWDRREDQEAELRKSLAEDL